MTSSCWDIAVPSSFTLLSVALWHVYTTSLDPTKYIWPLWLSQEVIRVVHVPRKWIYAGCKNAGLLVLP